MKNGTDREYSERLEGLKGGYNQNPYHYEFVESSENIYHRSLLIFCFSRFICCKCLKLTLDLIFSTLLFLPLLKESPLLHVEKESEQLNEIVEHEDFCEGVYASVY